MNALLDAALRLQQFCQSQNWQFCYIGGLAVQRWGEPRLTQDAVTRPCTPLYFCQLPGQ
ncbi:MAG: hypothetical protein KJ069_09370 [Anaerolineae bacterium]|nr:hypothetical protein [Anaerolineae bacterium]